MRIEGIFACDRNGVLGVNGRLPWHSPEDLQFFKRKTGVGILIMGRKTFESLPEPLAGRHHIVLSSEPRVESDNVTFVCSVDEALRAVPVIQRERRIYTQVDAYVIGGAHLIEDPAICEFVSEWHVTVFDRYNARRDAGTPVTQIDIERWRFQAGLILDAAEQFVDPHFCARGTHGGESLPQLMPYWRLTLRKMSPVF